MNEFCIGFLANAISTWMCFPLDTLMVRQQTSSHHLLRQNLFKGSLRASISTSTCNALVFSSYHGFQHSWWMSGALAGLLIQPFENGKICRQTNVPVTYSLLLRGLPLSVTREMIGVPIYFETYSYLKHSSFVSNNIESSWVSQYMCGGIAGIHSWLWTYPLSTIKANYVLQQKQSYHLLHLYRGFRLCALRSFFLNGLCFTMMERLRSKVYFAKEYL